MKTKFLLPHQFKFIGWILLIPSLLLGLYQLFFNYEPEWLSVKVPAFFIGSPIFSDYAGQEGQLIQTIENNIVDEVCSLLVIIGALFLLFAREMDEDEFVMKLRLESILWAALVNGLILIVAIILFYEFTFFYVMVFNLFLLFVLFIIRFQWVLHKFRREAE